MKSQPKLIETTRLPGAAGTSYSPMYKMHKYWSKKPSETIGEYIEKNTSEGDVVLDPFSGYGVTAFEAVRLGRRAVAIDLNPMSTFINRVILEPVNLSLLNWAFKDVADACEDNISDLFTTTCPACGSTKGNVDFVVRNYNEPLRIAYTCDCAKERLFKEPDKHDRAMDTSFEGREVPFWYPERVPLPTTQKERFQYVDELFTRRNLIALSQILHAIEGLRNERVRNVMRLAFSAALDKCSRLKPLSGPVDARPTLSLGWVAARFYAPPKWEEVNPWKAFENSFDQCRKGKRDSNERLSGVLMGSKFDELESGTANVIVLQGSCEKVMRDELPERSVDYVLTDPPFGSAIQYLTLSTFWGTWLGFHFDYEQEIVVDQRRLKSQSDYETRMQSVFYALGRVTKPSGQIHVFCNDVKGLYLHQIVNSLEKAGVKLKDIVHQPPPNSFGVNARAKVGRRGYYGSYVVGGQKNGEVDSSQIQLSVSEEDLRRRLSQVALPVIRFHGGQAEVATILHTVYRQLNGGEISAFAKHSAEEFLTTALGESAQRRKGMISLSDERARALSADDVDEGDLEQAVLDASTLFVGYPDPVNRIKQLVISRFDKYGVSPEDIRYITMRYTAAVIKKRRLERFTESLCLFGDKLGFQSECVVNGKNIVTWEKGGTPRCIFELGARKIKVSSLLPGSVSTRRSVWGSIPYISMERRIWEWCKGNPKESYDLEQMVHQLDGPSYELLTQSGNGSNHLNHVALKVIKNERVCDQHMLMLVRPLPTGMTVNPGQFFHMICDPGKSKKHESPLTLRRPFSIHGAQYPGFERSLLARANEMPREIREILERRPSTIDFFYKTVGRGTHSLAKVSRGVIIDAIGPCGNGFDIGSESAAIVVAGGIGVAPLVALVEQLRFFDKEVYVYIGAFKWEYLYPAVSKVDSRVTKSFLNGSAAFQGFIKEDFTEIGVKRIEISAGPQKLVTNLVDNDLSARRLPQDDVCLYACGPQPMLRAVSDLARRFSVKCQVLMEERMACGIGTCFSCVCDTIDSRGNTQKKRVCCDGPVFNAAEVKWTN